MTKNTKSKADELEAKIKSFDWVALKTLWQQIQEDNTPEWASGKAFEYLIVRAFELDGATVNYPYSVRIDSTQTSGNVIEQIDGAIHYAHLSCLIESKDYKENDVNIEPIAKLRNQLMRRPAGILGLIFSRQGFTSPASELAKYLAPQTILLWNGGEIDSVLKDQSICQKLLKKYQFCIEHGFPDFDTSLIKLEKNK